MNTISDFMHSIDRRDFERVTGRSTQSVTNAIRAGLFPAAWFIDVREYCEAVGIDTPEHLFRWSRSEGDAA